MTNPVDRMEAVASVPARPSLIEDYLWNDVRVVMRLLSMAPALGSIESLVLLMFERRHFIPSVVATLGAKGASFGHSGDDERFYVLVRSADVLAWYTSRPGMKLNERGQSFLDEALAPHEGQVKVIAWYGQPLQLNTMRCPIDKLEAGAAPYLAAPILQPTDGDASEKGQG